MRLVCTFRADPERKSNAWAIKNWRVDCTEDKATGALDCGETTIMEPNKPGSPTRTSNKAQRIPNFFGRVAYHLCVATPCRWSYSALACKCKCNAGFVRSSTPLDNHMAPVTVQTRDHVCSFAAVPCAVHRAPCAVRRVPCAVRRSLMPVCVAHKVRVDPPPKDAPWRHQVGR